VLVGALGTTDRGRGKGGTGGGEVAWPTPDTRLGIRVGERRGGGKFDLADARFTRDGTTGRGGPSRFQDRKKKVVSPGWGVDCQRKKKKPGRWSGKKGKKQLGGGTSGWRGLANGKIVPPGAKEVEGKTKRND